MIDVPLMGAGVLALVVAALSERLRRLPVPSLVTAGLAALTLGPPDAVFLGWFAAGRRVGRSTS